MKKILLTIALVGLVASAGVAATGSGLATQSGIPAISTVTVTNDIIGTNVFTSGTTKSTTTGLYWTNNITAAFTNLTFVWSGTKDVVLQFTANLSATNAAANTTLTWILAKSISGGTTTNANGSPLLFEQFATVTNNIAAYNTAAPTVLVNLANIPSTQANAAALTTLDAGNVNVYVFAAIPSGGSWTNCTVYVNGL